MTWRDRLEQTEMWAFLRDGLLVEERLANLDAAHLVRVCDWLLANAAKLAPHSVASNPQEWMRERPLFRAVHRLIEHPGESGVLASDLFTVTDLKVIRRELRIAARNKPDQPTQTAEIRRVLWKLNDVLKGR